MRSLITLTLVLAACNPLPKTVVMKGEIRSDLDDAAGPFAGATLRLLDEDAARIGTATADAMGSFRTEVPAGITFHAVVDGEGHVPASFSGVSGLNERFTVDDGVLHGLSHTEWDWWLTAFAGCPGVGEGGAVIAEPRVQELVNGDGEHPTVNAAVAELWDPETEATIPACYLDAETMTWDPDAVATGEAGLFAIFGAKPGVYVLSVGLEVFPDAWTWEDSLVYVPEGGAAPRFPAWVHFPLR